MKNFQKFKLKLTHLRETFYEWSLRANVNCYVKIFQYNHCLAKLFWLMILTISVCLTAWVISWSILIYLDYGVTSQIGVVYEMPTEFPAVTFCDTNPFTSSQANAQFWSWFGNEYLDLQTTYKKAKMLVSNPSYGDENRKQMGFGLDTIFCLYKNEYCTNDLHWYWDFDYGNCFHFNVGRNYNGNRVETKRATVEGTKNGLLIEIYPILNKNYEWTRYMEQGMIVFVHNSSFKPLITDAVFLKVFQIFLDFLLQYFF